MPYPVPPNYAQLMDAIREIVASNGVASMGHYADWPAEENEKTDGAVLLYWDADLPSRLRTPVGGYKVSGGSSTSPDTDYDKIKAEIAGRLKAHSIGKTTYGEIWEIKS